jgi:hypothetical protein
MKEKIDLIAELEKNHPEIANEFRKIVNEQFELFCKKTHGYGIRNIMLGGDFNNEEDRSLSIDGIVVRLSDKINRLINLKLKNREDVVNESITDTFQDILNYAVIALIITRNKWR